MKPAQRTRRSETLLYAALWLIIAALYLLDAMRSRAMASLPAFEPAVLAKMAATLLPFFIIFLINNNLLIPRLLLRSRFRAYFLAAAVAVALLWVYQYFDFMSHLQALPADFKRPPLDSRPRPLLPLPLFLDFTYGLLTIGANLAIALIFQHFDDKLERESLMKANAENQLAYLKAQINPHFYMNMLNNIHGLIELNPARAQSMVIDMSNLMRYMLYDSSRPAIPLENEVAFLRNYLRIMRQRYPENRVSITSTFPSPDHTRGITLPPLLFLVFIENAFKHGISFKESSFVAVSIEVDAETVRFSCRNSNHSQSRPDAEPEHSGIGLRNISRRLALLYGPDARLDLIESPETYTATLTIPALTHEPHTAANPDN